EHRDRHDPRRLDQPDPGPDAALPRAEQPRLPAALRARRADRDGRPGRVHAAGDRAAGGVGLPHRRRPDVPLVPLRLCL
ncbi:MAG: hypothetical protein AVDCRST_MAG68-5075, partial [uncultured Gemmatimonadetes bacterium]